MRTIQTELVKKGLIKQGNNQSSHFRKKSTEKLSEDDWKEIMGCNRGKFVRGKGGAFRQR